MECSKQVKSGRSTNWPPSTCEKIIIKNKTKTTVDSVHHCHQSIDPITMDSIYACHGESRPKV